MTSNKVDDQSANDLTRRLEEQYYSNFLPLSFTHDQSLDLVFAAKPL